MNNKLKKSLIHILAIVIMLIVACIYFSPVLSGEVVVQGDMQKAEAMSHQQKTVADSTGTVPNWNPSMFSGMPGYQTAVEPQKSVFTPLKSILIMRPLGVERNIGVLWLYLIGFYVAMIAFGCNPWLALLGAVSFGLGSYNIIIIEAGHITKAWAMAMIAPVLAGMVLSLRSVDNKKIKWKPLIWGTIIFTLSLGLQITFNHIQITFYTMIGGILIGLIYLVYAIKDKWFKQMLAIVGILLVGCLFAVGGNYRHLTVNQEYAKVTMRGGSEITVTPQDLGMNNETNSGATQSGGLDINYAFSWSYGVGETYTILVPGAMGGSSGESVADDSEWARRTGYKQAPLYWGDQPFTSGPVYFGAIIIFLFVLGCFVVRGPELWWIVIATLIAIVMSWGRHFLPLNEFLFNNLPLYNKFRTPSMSLVLANVTMTIMATLTLKTIIDTLKNKEDKKDKVDDYDARKRLVRALYWASGIVGGILLIGIIVAKSKLSFEGIVDEQYKAQLGNQWPVFQDMLYNERCSLFVRDSIRSIIFIALAMVTLLLFVNAKIKKSGIVIAILTILVAIDLWGVDNRYLNENNYSSPERVSLYRTPTEQLLDQTAATNGDKDYRVYDLTVNTFNDSRPSAFHNEIGGYSAAKLRRYQDLIDFYLGSKKLYDYVNNCQIGMHGYMDQQPLLSVSEPYPVLDMLNARYMMLNLQNQPRPVRRTTALGCCWLVEQIKYVENPNEEILALNDFDPYCTAIVDKSKFNVDAKQSPRDSSETITVVHTYPQTPDHLTYKSHTNQPRLAVFSEIYYEPDWRAYIDGEPAKYIRADYVLRAIVVPAGDHTIEFVNEAPTLHRLDTITLIISLVMIAAMAGALFLVYRKRGNSNPKA
ncbi:MAG: hypothetical protein J6X58_06075 [Bacteroidales bacterium]|nr:hypothetical protein [Bacteroidales bacterium]